MLSRLRPSIAANSWKRVASELAYRDIGPGVVSRTCREQQQRYFAPPIFQGDRSKYGRWPGQTRPRYDELGDERGKAFLVVLGAASVAGCKTCALTDYQDSRWEER